MDTKKLMEQMIGAALFEKVPCMKEDTGNSPSFPLQTNAIHTLSESANSLEKTSNSNQTGIHILCSDVWYDKDSNKIICNTWFLSEIPMIYCTLQAELFQDGHSIGKNTLAEIKKETVELTVIASPLHTNVTSDNIQVKFSILNKGLHTLLSGYEEFYSFDQLLSFEDIVESLTVIHPRNVHTPIGHTIQISYKRKSQLGNMVDYDYSDYYVASQNQPVHLDMEGEVTLKNDFAFIPGTFKIDKIFLRKEKEFRYYKGADPTITLSADLKTLHYSFPHDWNVHFDKSVGNACALMDFRLSATYRYKNSKGEENSNIIIVSSNPYFTVNSLKDYQPSYYMQIPNTLFYWGCMDENTKILMADGSQRKIKEISVGDRILGTDRQSLAVNNIYRGTEETLICIQSINGNEIYVTKDHPFITQNGEKAAILLKYGDQLLMSDGSYQIIEGAFPVEKFFVVYSLEVSPSGYFFGNGFAVGDFAAQGNANATLCQLNDYPIPETLINECKKINQALHHEY